MTVEIGENLTDLINGALLVILFLGGFYIGSKKFK
tara:strand:+ start:452 stop:556 length:105 start_codon:yes stop_codon:yes gene_type:complete